MRTTATTGTAAARTPASRDQGFTLIELMITIVVVAILTAIALPQYSNYVQRARRADAKTALLELAARQERFFAVNNAYTNNAANLGYGAGAAFPVNVSSGSTSYYTLATTVTAGSATTLPTFVATATPTGIQQKDVQCYTFQVNSLGVKSNLNSGGAVIAGANCW